MRLLIVNDQFETGGAGRVTSTMCTELAKRGYDISIITDNVNFSVRYVIPNTIPIYPVEFVNRKEGGAISRIRMLFKTVHNIRPIIKLANPDLIIAVQSNAFLRAFFANRGTGIPVIAVDHTSFARKMDAINTFTRHYLYKFADGLSILTKRDEKLLGNKYPKKRVIYNPLTYPLLNEATERQKTILCVGRFDIWKIKGFDLIVEIWAELYKQYPDWKLVFAGTGREESVNYIKGLVDEHKLGNAVVFLGQVDDMKTLYSHSGIFALSSRIEGFPMVLLEAMSQGCPCVAFSVGGASEEMIENDSGFVINDGDVASFKEALSVLMEDEDKRELYSNNAIKSASRFSIERFGDDWDKIIKEVLLKQAR